MTNTSTKTRLAIVEDHAMVREALVQFFASNPRFEVTGSVGTVREALVLVREHMPDVIVADLSLEDGNAIDLLRGLKRANHRTRTLILTGFRDEFSASEALRAGAVGYVFKHQPTSEILLAIDRVAAGETYVPPSFAGRLLRGAQRTKEGDPLARLTPREREIFHLVIRGSLSKTIGRDLGISIKTIDTHRTNINRKLGVRTTAALVRFAAAHGMEISKGPASCSSSEPR